MKTSELRDKSVSELHKLLIDTRQTLLESKRSLAAGELPNPRVVAKTRKEIARIHTMLTEKAKQTSKGDA